MGCSASIDSPKVLSRVQLPDGSDGALLSEELKKSLFLKAKALEVAESLFSASAGQKFTENYVRATLTSYGANCRLLTAYDKVTNEKVACKVIVKQPKKYQVQRAATLLEVGVLKYVEDHPNAVKLVNVFEDEKSYYIVMEHCSGGELFDHIAKGDQGLTERQAAQILRALMNFIAHMHSRGVAHMDVKPENIMFDSEGAGGVLKVVDFGSSVFIQPGEETRDAFGTVRYCSPEMAKSSCGQKTDVWSAGVILYQMLSGEAPFLKKGDDEKTLKMIQGCPKVKFSGKRWSTVTKEAKDCICAMLDSHVTTRPTATQVLDMPWMMSTMQPETQISAEIVAHLHTYASLSRVRRFLLHLLAKKLSGMEASKLMSTFYSLDVDCSGSIELSELVTAARKHLPQLTEEEISRVFLALDVDGTGDVDVSEFFAALLSTVDPKHRDVLVEKSFKDLDRSGKGFITKEALTNVLQSMNSGSDPMLNPMDLNQEVDAEFAKLDLNGDGVVTLEEFRCAINVSLPSSQFSTPLASPIGPLSGVACQGSSPIMSPMTPSGISAVFDVNGGSTSYGQSPFSNPPINFSDPIFDKSTAILFGGLNSVREEDSTSSPRALAGPSMSSPRQLSHTSVTAIATA